MSLTRTQVIDALQGAVTAAWNTTGFDDRVKYENVGVSSASADAAPFTGNDPWIRSTIRHSLGLGKISLSNAVGGSRWDRRGVLIVQVFTAKGTGLPGSADLPKVIQGAFEGVSLLSGLVHRTVDVQEIGESGNWYQTNVSITFEYDELR